MKINTTRFGEIEFDDEQIFNFVDPILGYENEDKYVLVDHNEQSNLKWLQSIKTPELAFVVTVAGFFGIEYSFELPDATQEKLEIEETEDILALNIVVIPHENPRNSTINLLAPLIINLINKKAAQVVLPGTAFPVDYPLFDKGALC